MEACYQENVQQTKPKHFKIPQNDMLGKVTKPSIVYFHDKSTGASQVTWFTVTKPM